MKKEEEEEHSTPTVVASLKIWNNFEKMLPAPFQHFRFRFQPLFIKVLPLPQKINRFRFHIPG